MMSFQSAFTPLLSDVFNIVPPLVLFFFVAINYFSMAIHSGRHRLGGG